MNSVMRLFVCSVLWLCCAPAAATAAEFAVVGKLNEWAGIQETSPQCAVRMTGEIRQGDAAKLAHALSGPQINSPMGFNVNICLDSPGGSYDEGIKIAEFLVKHRLGTYVEAGKQCFSACAIIFMAGVLSTGAEEYARPARRIHLSARLGFHAPFIASSALPAQNYDAKTVIAAYQAAS